MTLRDIKWNQKHLCKAYVHKEWTGPYITFNCYTSKCSHNCAGIKHFKKGIFWPFVSSIARRYLRVMDSVELMQSYQCPPCIHIRSQTPMREVQRSVNLLWVGNPCIFACFSESLSSDSEFVTIRQLNPYLTLWRVPSDTGRDKPHDRWGARLY